MKPSHIHLKNSVRLVVMLASAVLIFNSCQKVINLDLNTANPQLVIFGYVTDQPGIDTIKITKSGSYFNPGNYPNVTNATVIISDNMGVTDTLKQMDSGVYTVPPGFTGVSGHTYSLRALVNGKEYDASSTMPNAVTIDSVSIYSISTTTDSNGYAVNDTNYHVRCFFQDPPGTGHYYRLQSTINGVVMDSLDDLTITSDEFDAGTLINVRLRGVEPIQGSLVTVYLMSIDPGTYNFYDVVRTIASAGNPVSTAVPQNPPTNITNGALGYFSAYTMRSETQVAP
jgi:hypothetical protein